MARRCTRRFWLQALEDRTAPAVFTVMNINDSGPGSLRQAVLDSNVAVGAADSIGFDPSLTLSGAATIYLDSSLTLSDTTGSVTIIGPGSALLNIDGKNATRLLAVNSNVTASISGLTLTHGMAASGGGIANNGSLSIDACTISFNGVLTGGTNSPGGSGGGITNSGVLNISNGSVANNTAGNAGTNGDKGGDGGGIFSTGSLTITNCQISNNSAGKGRAKTTSSSTSGYGGGGGGIFAGGSLTMTSCTVSFNHSGDADGNNVVTGGADGGNGGGLAATGSATITTCTFSNNACGGGAVTIGHFAGDGGNGGAIFNGGTMTISGGAITNNSAGIGGFGSFGGNGGQGGRGGGIDSEGSLIIVNSSIQGNSAGIGGVGLRTGLSSSPGGDGGGVYCYGLLNMSHCTVSTNKAGDGVSGNGDSSRGGSGGGVLAGSFTSPVVINDSIISGNSAGQGGGGSSGRGGAGGFGGGLFTFGLSASVDRCVIADNHAGNGGTTTGTFGGEGGQGGGVYMLYASSGMQSINATTITGNSAGQGGNAGGFPGDGGAGGGVAIKNWNTDQFAMTNCEVSLNSAGKSGVLTGTGNANALAGQGGGIYEFGGSPTSKITLANCTITGNTAGNGSSGNPSRGGGCYFRTYSGSATISNCTITGNSAQIAGGVSFWGTANVMRSSIFAGNSAPTNPDVDRMFTSLGFNLVQTPGTTTGYVASDHTNVNPLLGSLGNYGGNTKTTPLLAGSPAIDTGSNALSIANDQRGAGFARVSGAAADIGAFEVQLPPRVAQIAVNGTDPQRSQVTFINVIFDSLVNLPADPATAFELRRQADNQQIGLKASVSSGAGTIVTLTFTGPLTEFSSLQDGRYTLTIFANQIVNNNGILDGNADGVAGGDYTLVGTPANGLFRLKGDGDGNGVVDGGDFSLFRQFFATNNLAFDFDHNGIVDGLDFGQFRQRFGMVI